MEGLSWKTRRIIAKVNKHIENYNGNPELAEYKKLNAEYGEALKKKSQKKIKRIENIIRKKLTEVSEMNACPKISSKNFYQILYCLAYVPESFYDKFSIVNPASFHMNEIAEMALSTASSLKIGDALFCYRLADFYENKAEDRDECRKFWLLKYRIESCLRHDLHLVIFDNKKYHFYQWLLKAMRTEGEVSSEIFGLKTVWEE